MSRKPSESQARARRQALTDTADQLAVLENRPGPEVAVHDPVCPVPALFSMLKNACRWRAAPGAKPRSGYPQILWITVWKTVRQRIESKQ